MERIRATRGVVLATSSGDGWRLAMPAGGEVSVGVVRQGMVQLHVPGEQLPDGTPVTRGNYELRMRHGIVVNRQGQRFGNEHFFQALGAAACLRDLGRPPLRQSPLLPHFRSPARGDLLVCGPATRLQDGVGAPGPHAGRGGAALQMPATALEATVARFNAHAHRGEGRGFPPRSGESRCH